MDWKQLERQVETFRKIAELNLGKELIQLKNELVCTLHDKGIIVPMRYFWNCNESPYITLRPQYSYMQMLTNQKYDWFLSQPETSPSWKFRFVYNLEIKKEINGVKLEADFKHEFDLKYSDIQILRDIGKVKVEVVSAEEAVTERLVCGV